MYIKQIIVRYKYKVFKATLPIYRELLLYILYITYSRSLKSDSAPVRSEAYKPTGLRTQ